MTSTSRITTLAALVAGAFAAGSASAAVRLTDAFDGNWFDPGQAGRGIAIDYVPIRAVGERNRGVLFGAIFSFDNAGNPLWLTIQSDLIGEFDFEVQAPIRRIAAGTWPTPGAATGTVVGTATITVNSCNSITYDLDMTPESGLVDVTFDFERTDSIALSADSLAGSCVWQREFSGCPAFATPVPGVARACLLQGDILNQDITLTNDTTWVVNGKLSIGLDSAQSSTLRIEPGTLIVGTGDTFDHIAVLRGSKIFAEGTLEAPIVFTSPFELPGADGEPSPGDIGGLAIAGNAPANCVPNCVAEWDPTFRYGGADASESSGVVRYMQVRYAGFVFAANRELNSFTFAGLGSGTVLEHLQAFRGQDDSFEWFGGTANGRYLVSTCPGDDGYDWDEGYQGKLQFGLIQQQGCSGEDHGFELANSPTNFDAAPRAQGRFANITALGNPQASRNTDGLQIKEGSAGNFWNLAITGFTRSCVALQDLPTFAAAGTPQNLSGLTTIQGSVISCASNFRTSPSGAPFTAEAWFNAQQGNAAVADLGLGANGLGPAPGSPLLGRAFNPGDDWFVPTSYAGAFASDQPKDNWTLGWTMGVNP